jgi:syntenin-1
MTVDTMAKTQVNQERLGQAIAYSRQTGTPVSVSLYGDLGLEEMLDSYGGLDISQLSIQKFVAPEVASQMQRYAQPLACITPVGDKSLARAEVKQGVREVILCKDGAGKIGVAFKAIDKGIFISFVWKDSPAALAGLRFGDQILQINGASVAGFSADKMYSVVKKADGAKIRIAVRDRPFDRTLTVVKDSENRIGFLFDQGEISAIVKDSSAARNGLLINHQLVEVNGQNVVGLKDKDTLKIMQDAPRSVTLTILPKFIFEHLTKHISVSEMRKNMDHGIADV